MDGEIANVLGNINGFLVLIIAVAGGIGSLITWFIGRNKVASENAKDVKVNNADGDTALIATIEVLKNQLAANIIVGTELSNTNVEIRNKINEQQILIDQYKIKIKRSKLAFAELLEIFSKDKHYELMLQDIIKDLRLDDDI